MLSKRWMVIGVVWAVACLLVALVASLWLVKNVPAQPDASGHAGPNLYAATAQRHCRAVLDSSPAYAYSAAQFDLAPTSAHSRSDLFADLDLAAHLRSAHRYRTADRHAPAADIQAAARMASL